MKKFLNKFLVFFIFASFIFCFTGCEGLFSKNDKTPAASTNPSGLTINFNGATLDNKSSIKFTSEEIAPFVGMEIFDALYELNFGIENLKKDGSMPLGFTKKKDGNDFVQFLPTFGTIYAKWGNSSGGGGSVDLGESVLVTFDLNGGYVLDELGNMSTSNIEMSISESTWFDTIINPYRDGYTFAGWSLTRDGENIVQKPLDITSSNKIVYAVWRSNIELFRYGDIAGDFTVDENGRENPQLLTYLGNGISTYQFTYDSSIMNAWGSQESYGPNTVRFKVRPTRDWSVCYGSWDESGPVINGDYFDIERTMGDYTDIVVRNLQDGVTYTIQVEVTNSGNCRVKIYTPDYGNTGGNNGGSSEPEYPSEPEDPPSEPEIPSEIQSLGIGSMKIDYVTDGNSYSFYCYAGSSYTVDWYDDYDRSTLLDELLSENGISGSSVDIKVSMYSPDGDELCSTKDSGPYTFTANYTGDYYIYVEPYSSGDSGYFAIFVEG